MVFAGEFWAGASERGLAEGFRDLGWVVHEVDRRSHGLRMGRSLPARAAARATRRVADDLYRTQVLDACSALKPDVFMTIKGMAVDAGLLREIKRTGARAAMFYPDYHFDYPGVFPESFGEYDLFVTTKRFQLAHLSGQLGAGCVAYVPHGFSDRVHRPLYAAPGEGAFEVDVGHAGNYSPYKHGWIDALARAVPEASLRVVGHRWAGALNPAASPRLSVLDGRFGARYVAAIQSARINLSVHMGPHDNGWQDLVSTRTFEIPACKGFMLHIDNEEVREFFTPGVEIDVFSTHDELADKVRFYLARPELRNEMIERAYTRCVPAYSYAARAAEIDRLLAA